MMEGPELSRHPKDVSHESDCSIVQSLSTTAHNLSKVYKNDNDRFLTLMNPVPSPPLLNQYSFTKENNSAIYDKMPPVVHKYKFNNRSKKRNHKEEVIAKLNELKMDDKKDPVTKLNEINLLMKKTVIQYEMISMSGTSHSPIITIRAKNGDIIAYGCGSSKKVAKKNAAIEFLKKMENCNGQNDITSTTSNEDLTENVLEKRSETNPIGVLQELCVINHWQFPQYEYFKEVLNKSNSVEYNVKCSLKIFKSTGKGKSKQLAKKQAAHLLYDKIKCLTPEEKDVLNHNEYERPSKILFDENKFVNNYLVKLGMITPSEIQKYVEIFINQLKLSKNPSINHLKSLCNIKELKNAINILNQIGEEEGFTSTYIELETMNSNPEILVQVSTLPLMVNLGFGNTIAEAQEAAAYGFLIYLKLLLEE